MLPMGTRKRNPRRSLVGSPVSVPVSSYEPFSPLALQPKLWLDASDLTTITSSGGAVSEWRDKSGNGYAFTQATSTLQPLTGSTTQNGLNVLSFDGADDFLLSTAASSEWKFLHDGTEHLFGMVAQRQVSGVFGPIFCTTQLVAGIAQIGARVNFNPSDNFIDIRYGAAGASAVVVINSAVSAGASTAPKVYSSRIAPSASATNRSTVQVNAAQPITPNGSTGAASTANPFSTLYIGVQPNLLTSLNGFIAELVFVTGSAVTNQNRQLLHNYLNRKWAIY